MKWLIREYRVDKRELTQDTKSLSINNIDLEPDFSIGHDRCGQVVECHETSMELFIAHQEFAKAVKSAVSDFDYPAPGLFRGMGFELLGFLPASFNMGNVAVLFDDAQSRGTRVAGIGAQMLVPALAGVGFVDPAATQHRAQLGDIMAIGPGHHKRQRHAASVYQQVPLAAIFSPISWIGSN